MSLFDTWVKINDDLIVKPKADILYNDTDTMKDRREDNKILDIDDEPDYSKFEKRVLSRFKCPPKCVLEKVDEDIEDSVDSDINYSVLSNIGGDEDSDIDYADSNKDDGPDRFSDDSSVTDDEYNAGPKETSAII